jgi:hypothetical protein
MGPMAEGVQAAGPRKFTIQMPKASTLRTDVDILNCAGRRALRLPIGRNDDLGTSPFFEQLFGQVTPACKQNNGHAADKEQ